VAGYFVLQTAIFEMMAHKKKAKFNQLEMTNLENCQFMQYSTKNDIV